jgi:spore coat polysaccharide biosynthesis protein SpsF (cytidylyltransferase family)
MPSIAAHDEKRPLAVIQARTGSVRLPRKVLADLCGRPLLGWLVQRVRSSRTLAGLVVATTTDRGDDAVEELCDRLAVPVFRGHPTDVLRRYVDAAAQGGAAAVVRISGDSPFIDSATVDCVVSDFLRGGADLVENHRVPGWPVGTAVEAMTMDCLNRLDAEAKDDRHREHVTLYAIENPGRFELRHVPPPESMRAPDLRICVDTAEDLERAREICADLDGDGAFAVKDIVARWGRVAP